MRNVNFYQNRFLIQQEEYEVLTSQKRLGEQNIQEISDNLDSFFIAEKLRYVCLLLSHQAVYKKEYQLSFLAGTLAYVEKENLLNRPAIALYYYAYHALKPMMQHLIFSDFNTLMTSSYS